MPDGNSGRRWTTAFALFVVLVLVAGTVWLVLVWTDSGAESADPQASVLAVLLAAAKLRSR
jgi:hypothetical protein